MCTLLEHGLTVCTLLEHGLTVCTLLEHGLTVCTLLEHGLTVCISKQQHCMMQAGTQASSYSLTAISQNELLSYYKHTFPFTKPDPHRTNNYSIQLVVIIKFLSKLFTAANQIKFSDCFTARLTSLPLWRQRLGLQSRTQSARNLLLALALSLLISSKCRAI